MEWRNAIWIPVVLAMIALGGGGCAHRGGIAGATTNSAPSEDAELLRSVRQPVRVERSAETGYTFFHVGAEDDPRAVSLELRPAEIELLRALPTGRPVEVRYWESLSKSVPGTREVRVGELESILDGPLLLVDRSACELHDQRMSRREALILYGLPSSKLVDAWQKFFPHAALTLGGSVVGPDSPRTELSHVCAVCQEAYEQWTESGGAEKN